MSDKYQYIDRIAGMALQGMITNPFWNDEPYEHVALHAYLIAKCMWKEREGFFAEMRESELEEKD